MEWQHLATFVLTENWQCSQHTNARSFRITHQINTTDYRRLIALATLVSLNNEKPEIFKQQRIQYHEESEIIQFPNPPKGWQYGIAVKQLVLPGQILVDWEVKIDMPSYPLEDAPVINPVAATSKNATTVPVTTTATKLLSVNTNRKGVKFYNPHVKETVYVDTDNVVNSTSAIEKIAAKNVSIPTINWQGEYWAISSAGTVALEIEEYV